MKIFVFLITFFIINKIFSQFYIISNSEVELSPINFQTTNEINKTLLINNIEQNIYWQKSYKEQGQKKFMYTTHSVKYYNNNYNIGLYGIDVDMMSEDFEKNWANNFRYWNKLRFGFKILIQNNPDVQKFKIKNTLNYLNEEFYISLLHIPKKARGDLMTKYRKKSFGLYVDAIPDQKSYIQLAYKAFEYVWFKVYYKKEFGVLYQGVFSEFEINKRGYDNSIVKYTHDSYKGVSFIIGNEYNNSNKYIFLYLGFKFCYRNN